MKQTSIVLSILMVTAVGAALVPAHAQTIVAESYTIEVTDPLVVRPGYFDGELPGGGTDHVKWIRIFGNTQSYTLVLEGKGNLVGAMDIFEYNADADDPATPPCPQDYLHRPVVYSQRVVSLSPGDTLGKDSTVFVLDGRLNGYIVAFYPHVAEEGAELTLEASAEDRLFTTEETPETTPFDIKTWRDNRQKCQDQGLGPSSMLDKHLDELTKLPGEATSGQAIDRLLSTSL